MNVEGHIVNETKGMSPSSTATITTVEGQMATASFAFPSTV
jgi:hypothetical protein